MLPEFLNDKNTIFHYTKAITAIKYILPEKSLLYSPRNSSHDPLENKEIIISKSIAISDSKIEESTKNDSHMIYDLIRKRMNTNNQISFCFNEISKIHCEYGYKKSRMWNQYGDNFKGACLAFNKQELLKNSTINLWDKVEYIPYDKFENDYLDIYSNDLSKYGRKEYKENRISLSNYLLFRKHLDFRDECEFRIINFGQPQHISIEPSLLGIIVCGNIISTKNFIGLKKFAKYLNVPLIDVNFSHSGCNVVVEPNNDYLEKYFQIIRPYKS
ncbi:DUF2971 domain-containing protein [Aequorivita capsosiphonis]|uniref:DUF2971 domain-containing protein n=1 Tax=Aequorivita capsosiphonis TaxID=487317 RepID=UPI0003F7C767|nr:DUF2971 domain-containing protein [Aequorivita capsosiphonis]